jgi:hypothetical protein
VLDRATTYFVRVQFFDAVPEASEWSDAVEFRTVSAVVDADQDGVPDASEVGGTVDLNGDGVADNDQPDIIKSAQTAVASHVAVGVCKESDSITEINLLEPIHPSTILDKKNKPKNFVFGLSSYRVTVNPVGSTARVRVYYSSPITGSQGYYLYDTVNGWQDFTNHATFNEGGRSVTLEVQDGGHGDSDGVANGVIVDPGGVVAVESGSDSIPTSSKGDSSGGGGAAACFIAAAAGDERGENRTVLLTAGLLIVGAFVGCAMRRGR